MTRSVIFTFFIFNQVQWKSESAGIISEDFRFLQGSERYSIEQPTRRDWNLVIRNVKFSDAGIYVCICYGTSTYEVVSHLIVRGKSAHFAFRFLSVF